jgi:feruloyl esterase
METGDRRSPEVITQDSCAAGVAARVRPLRALLLLSAMAASGVAVASPGAAACAALKTVAIRNTVITKAEYVTAATGPYCEIEATVAPHHDVRIRLPDQWQGRYVQWGGGGFDGQITSLDMPGRQMTVGLVPTAMGFAVAASNGGHRASDYPGATFAADRTLTLSYSVAKIYDTDLVARTLLKDYYGQPARFNYFVGCSNGGKNASVAASNYMDHYDGVVGQAGVYGHADDNVGGADMPGLTSKWARTVAIGALPLTKGDALYAKSVAACDAMDGLKDGIIANPEGCPFKEIAQSMRCTGANSNACLTDTELQQVDQHASDLVLDGKVIGPRWSRAADFAHFESVLPLSAGFLSMAFRQSQPVDPLTYDIPSQFLDVKTVLDDIYSMSGDLDGIVKYLAKDKKLLLWHGWEDTTVPPYGSVHFYEALRKAAVPGSANNVKLYMAPGVGHCGDGAGANVSALLYVISRWVEQNAEPGSPANPIVAWHRPTNDNTGPQGIESAVFTRPLCEYPSFPFYSGKGDPNSASSFVCRPGNRRER